MNWRQVVRTYWLEARMECLKTARMLGTVIPMILFPLGFYLFFGVAMGSRARDGYRLADYLVGTYGTFGVLSACLVGFGVGVAVERGMGWLQLKRAAPMPVLAYFAAKTAACLLLTLVAMGTLFLAAVLFGNVTLPVSTWVILGATLVAGSVPFCALGLAIGYLAGPNSAPGVVNLVYMALAFCSGLWIPLPALPEIMRNAAPALPPYHLAQLALTVLGQPSDGRTQLHILALTGFTVVFAVAAVLAYRREEDKLYG